MSKKGIDIIDLSLSEENEFIWNIFCLIQKLVLLLITGYTEQFLGFQQIKKPLNLFFWNANISIEYIERKWRYQQKRNIYPRLKVLQFYNWTIDPVSFIYRWS